MSKSFVLIGDDTTQGGQVISASSTMVVNGKKVILVGDKVSCPKDGHGINAIIEGSPEWPLTVKPWLWRVATVSAVVR
jgi:uncharacterized Zn-binding protein involved in type VI secretion